VGDANVSERGRNFEAQTHRVFALMDQTLQRVGGTLANLVKMTIFIKEPRFGDRFVEIRKEKFADGHYPGSGHELRAARGRDPRHRGHRRPRLASTRVCAVALPLERVLDAGGPAGVDFGQV
jgi:enamine deaminase RidA (YjgF/YER057c/UK114 family)